MSDSEKHVSKRTCLKSKRSRFILAIVVLIVIIAAVVPSVVVTTLRKKNNMGPKAKVFVPLYVYPAPEAWAPLENVYVSNPFHPNFLSPHVSGLLSIPAGSPPHYVAPFGRQSIPSHIKIKRKEKYNREKQLLNVTGYLPTPMSTLPS